MQNRNQILSYFAETNADSIHLHGKAGTDVLLKFLDCKPNENILEIGFGTGATLTKLASRYKNTHFWGVEFSELMYKKTIARLKFSRLGNRVGLKLALHSNEFPFGSNSFDKIFAESVLGIQENEELDLMISEISRMLKPGGKLFLNETIWLNTILKEEINHINNICKNTFGIIQSNGMYAYQKDWETLLIKNKLNVLSIETINNFITHQQKLKNNYHEKLSNFYSILGKIKGRYSKSLSKEYKNYKREMGNIFEDKKYLEGYLFIAEKEL